MSIETSTTVTALMKALHAFQGCVSGVQRDSANPHFKNRYASLEGVIDTARPHLQANGLVFSQAPGRVVDGCIEVTTRITHAESGEWQQSTMHVPLGKRDPQGAGSAMTYGQRYSLMAALGLPPTDDDAEAAVDRNNQRPAPPRANSNNADRNKTIADTMIDAINQTKTRAQLNAWEGKQRPEIDALDDANRRRVDAAGERRFHELPEAA